LEGKFELYHGECPDTNGRPAYFNPVKDLFLFFYSPGGDWQVAAVCGASSAIWTFGKAGWYPFEDTAAIWQCSENGPFAPGSVSIECSYYDGQVLPCSPGKYEPAGEAPDGNCANSCPPHIPDSAPGSTSISSCVTYGANFLIVSQTERILELNRVASEFSLAIEGGDLRDPKGVACVSEIICLFTNLQGSNVVAFNLRGEVVGVFARVGNPFGLLHIKRLNLLAVASFSGDGQVLLFDLANLDLEQTLEVSSAYPLTHAKSQKLTTTSRSRAMPSRRS
jgi:hypothetical protein